MSVPDNVKQRIAQLLNLADRGDMNEAENASAAAAKLCAKYRIDAAEARAALEDNTVENILTLEGAFTTRRYIRWKTKIVGATAKASGCNMFLQNSAPYLVGRREDIDTANYLARLIIHQVDKLARASGLLGRKQLGDFRLGAADRISERVQEAVALTRDEAKKLGQGAAIIRLDALAERVTAAMPPGLVRRTRSKIKVYADAYNSGRKAGNSVSITGKPARGALTS